MVIKTRLTFDRRIFQSTLEARGSQDRLAREHRPTQIKITSKSVARLRTAMRELRHGEKLQLIEECFARRRKQSDGDNEATAKALARNECDLSRGTAYKLIVKEKSLTDPELVERLDDVFRKLVIAEPGSVQYRRQWARIKKAIKTGDDFEKLGFIASSVGAWADIALDETRSDAERILVGRLVQYVLYYASRCKPVGTSLDINPTLAFDRGFKVNAEVVKILLRNDSAPAGLFDHGSAEAQARGYKVFRTRLLADELGWQQPKTDEGRAALFTRAYKSGIASVLMQIDEDLGHRDVSYPYRAFVMATHAADWPRAGEYALTVFKYFPEILTKKVDQIKAMLDDRDVWPGVAAMIALRRADIPVSIRETLGNPKPHQQNAVEAISAMADGINSSNSYLTVLEKGKTHMKRFQKKAATTGLRVGSIIDWPVTGGTINS